MVTIIIIKDLQLRFFFYCNFKSVYIRIAIVMKGQAKNNTDIIEIYKKLEAELASIDPGCNACGTCCHFDAFGHVLYTSSIEIDYIRGKCGNAIF